MTSDQVPHIDEVAPFSEKDEACLQELREVLRKHNALTRFGVSLLHDHFEIADDEVLLETCDPVQRTLLSRPVKKSELGAAQLIETNWRLDGIRAVKTCTVFCRRIGEGGRHLRRHEWGAI